MIFISILFLPFGLAQALFVPDYWYPQVIYKFFGLFDIESLLFSFFMGGIAATLYQELFNYHLRKSKKRLAPRYHNYIIYFSLIFFSGLLIIIKLFTTLSVLRTSFIIILILTPYFLIARRDLWRVSLVGGLVFTIFYILFLYSISLVFPDFIVKEWNPNGLLGIYLLKIPIEEYLYSFFTGLVGSVIFEEIKNIKLVQYKK